VSSQAPPRAVLDSDIIFSRVLHELIGRLAARLRLLDLFWSEELLAEAKRSLIHRKGLSDVTAQRWVDYLRQNFPRVDLPTLVLQGYQDPPSSPAGCIFAQTTSCVSSDMTTAITPCQFGGRPVCTECGCMASAGLAAIAKYKLAGLVQVGALFAASRKLGEQMAGLTA